MSLQIKSLGLDGVLEILPPRFEDDRRRLRSVPDMISIRAMKPL
jgi:hypothetical protein